MKQIYKNATIGSSVNIQLGHVLSAVSPIELDIKKLTKGWNVLRDKDHWKVCGNVHVHVKCGILTVNVCRCMKKTY